ncbi:hypothetical protein DRP04_13030 [Archaeoglobales archaeon]|nr:MAG: hypothetical protein DRP04_13030 [Archaeoglobales archaeon]
MWVKKFSDPHALIRLCKSRNILPLKVIKVKLKHNERENHYLYIFYITAREVAFTDDPTDFSGVGGSYHRILEDYLTYLKAAGIPIEEYEMPFKLYNEIATIYMIWLLENKGEKLVM